MRELVLAYGLNSREETEVTFALTQTQCKCFPFELITFIFKVFTSDEDFPLPEAVIF